MKFGYAGKILRVNLSKRKVKKQPVTSKLAKKFIGGKGIATKILFDEVEPNVDPLGPKNKLIFGTGPVTGCPVPAANRLVIITKSPLTGLFLDTYAGGHFAPELKFAGFDFVVIEGRSKQPVYTYIEDEHVIIKEASHLWGRDCWETEKILKDEIGGEAKVACIGPAGEKAVNFALVSHDYFHQCGRGGAGAVMGSKNLKAIAVSGSKGIRIHKYDELMKFVANEIEYKFSKGPLTNTVRDRMQFGTPLTMDFTQQLGILPTYNFKKGCFEKYEEINCYRLRRDFIVSDKSCYSCNTPCCKFSIVKFGKYGGVKLVGPEYETLALLGSNLGIDKLDSIIKANELCDRLGVDTISVGNVIGFAMGCYEKKILTKEEVDGIDLEFGNDEAVMRMISKIAYREGIGSILADGVRVAAEKIGKGSKEFAMHSKGMEYPAYEPRGSPAFALLYAITERGACHRRAWPVIAEMKLESNTIKSRAKLVKDLYDARIVLHCGLVCDFPYNISGINTEDFTKMLSYVTGWQVTLDQMYTLAERVASLTRAFNIREGTSRKNDILATRTMKKQLPNGPSKGKLISKQMLDSMLDEYYKMRGWDEKTGIPLKECLEKLGLSDVAHRIGKVDMRGNAIERISSSR